MTGESPLLRWNAGDGIMVVTSSEQASSAQKAKVRHIIAHRLIRRLDSTTDDGRTTTAYRVDPVRGCSQPNYVTHTRTLLPNSKTQDTYTCRCQCARGTRVQAPRTCAHILAVAQHVQEREGRPGL